VKKKKGAAVAGEPDREGKAKNGVRGTRNGASRTFKEKEKEVKGG